MTTRLIRARLPAADASAARALASLLGEAVVPEPVAVSEFEAQPAGYLVDAYYAEEADANLAAALHALLPADAAAVLQLEPVPDENWVTLSQAALPPVEAGRFVVHGSHDRERVGRRLNAILIDAGEAFGTAHHATTAGCLEAIDVIARRQAPRRVLDLGCGSGVLAIAAAKALPRATILASDIDPIAVEVARANAVRNGVGARLDIFVADGMGDRRLRPPAVFDLVVANILARPLVALAPRLSAVVAPGGRLVLSGLLVAQEREVAAAYRAAGLRLASRRHIAGWSTLVLGRG